MNCFIFSYVFTMWIFNLTSLRMYSVFIFNQISGLLLDRWHLVTQSNLLNKVIQRKFFAYLFRFYKDSAFIKIITWIYTVSTKSPNNALFTNFLGKNNAVAKANISIQLIVMLVLIKSGRLYIYFPICLFIDIYF